MMISDQTVCCPALKKEDIKVKEMEPGTSRCGSDVSFSSFDCTLLCAKPTHHCAKATLTQYFTKIPCLSGISYLHTKIKLKELCTKGP